MSFMIIPGTEFVVYTLIMLVAMMSAFIGHFVIVDDIKKQDAAEKKAQAESALQIMKLAGINVDAYEDVMKESQDVDQRLALYAIIKARRDMIGL